MLLRAACVLSWLFAVGTVSHRTARCERAGACGRGCLLAFGRVRALALAVRAQHGTALAPSSSSLSTAPFMQSSVFAAKIKHASGLRYSFLKLMAQSPMLDALFTERTFYR